MCLRRWESVKEPGLRFNSMRTTYFIGRETILATRKARYLCVAWLALCLDDAERRRCDLGTFVCHRMGWWNSARGWKSDFLRVEFRPAVALCACAAPARQRDYGVAEDFEIRTSFPGGLSLLRFA